MTNAESVLLEFMTAMKLWEEKYYQLYREANGVLLHADTARREPGEIYGRYLTVKERSDGRIAGPDVGFPPEFDPAREQIVAINAATAHTTVIETVWTHPTVPDSRLKNRYILVEANGNFLLDRKERFRAFSQQWQEHPL